MSIESWKREFYPIEAEKQPDTPAADLLKWTGLRAENLAKHGLTRVKPNRIRDRDDNCFSINTDSCSLCERYYDIDNCYGCPLVDLAKRCGINGDGTDPYSVWMFTNDPEPMIKCLQEVVDNEPQ